MRCTHDRMRAIYAAGECEPLWECPDCEEVFEESELDAEMAAIEREAVTV